MHVFNTEHHSQLFWLRSSKDPVNA